MVMFKVNVFEAKAKLSEYLDRAAAGERIVICRHNKPVAELRPIETVRTEQRPIGPLPGETPFEVPPSFFEPMSDQELDLWDGIAPTDPLSSFVAAKHDTPKVDEQRARYRAGKAASAKADRPARVRRRR